MKKSTPRRLTMAISFITLAGAVLPLVAEAQSSPGRYRKQGQSRAKSPTQIQQQKPYINRNLYGSPWNPSFYRQDKFFQVQPESGSFTGNPSHSHLHHHGGLFYSIGTPVPGLPGYGQYAYGRQSETPPPAPPPPAAAPAPQVIVVQPPAPAPAAPERSYEPPPPPPPAAPVSTEPGEVELSVYPPTTRILINDRLVGTGESLAAKGEPLVLKPGVYVLAAEHGDYTAQRLVFAVVPEQTVRVFIDLTAEGFGRRARVESGNDEGFLLN